MKIITSRSSTFSQNYYKGDWYRSQNTLSVTAINYYIVAFFHSLPSNIPISGASFTQSTAEAPIYFSIVGAEQY